VVQVAVPFMKEPFQRPLSDRLDVLPKGISDAYKQFVQGLSGNYLQLLRTALQWTLFASSPVRVVEIMDAFTGVYRLSEKSSRGIDATEKKETYAVRIADRLEEVQQLRTAGGPFLDIWDEEGDWWVSLADLSQARQFCVSRNQPGDDHENHQVHHGPVCIKCDIPLERSNALLFSEKELHLEMAIASLKHLNNPRFQMQSGELPQWIEDNLDDGLVVLPQDESSPAGSHMAAESSETESNTAIEPSNVVEDAKVDKDIERRPSTSAQISTVEAEEPAQFAGSADSEHNSDAHDGSVAATGYEDIYCRDCMASDESGDEEDRRVGESNADGQEADQVNEGATNYWRRRTTERFRYEANCWYDHLRRAEELYSWDEIWSSPAWAELRSELDRFIHDVDFFKRWQWMLFLREIETEYFNDLPWKPLHLASFLGLTSWAQHLIAGGHSLAEKSGGVTPLIAAGLKAGNASMLQLLLEHGADPNDTDDKVGTPCLHRWLCHDQSYKAVKLFIDHGADPTMGNPNGQIAVHYLAVYGHDDPEASEVLKLLITSGPRSEKIINTEDLWKSTPLHHLLSRREVPKELLNQFILQGADVNVDDYTSLRPLQDASHWGDIDVVKLLLPKVTHVDDPDRHGRTALHEAARAGHREIVELLINDKGADPNIKDFHDRTPLFFAFLSDPSGRVGESRRTIKFLLETLHQRGFSPSDINSATKRNRTPLRQAAACGFNDILEDLLHMLSNSNANTPAAVNAADTREGQTALHCAAAGGHSECVQLLLDSGADVRIADKSDKTALQLCYEQWALTNRQCFEDTALLLCAQDPSAAVRDAELPAIAATNNSRKMLEKLAALNVDLARPDQFGWTPLKLAKRSRSFEAKGYLEEYFARDAQLPSRWLDPDGCASLSESGLDITYIDKFAKAVLTSDRPLPAHLSKFYFEIRSVLAPEIKKDPKSFPIMAIGFCTLGAAGLEFPGWPPLNRTFSTRSWAYHGDDGGFFDGVAPRGMDHASPYQPGNTVGCGIDLEEGRMWFTLNGKRLDKEFLGVGGRLFPVVGLEENVVLETRFTEPFFSDDVAESADAHAKLGGPRVMTQKTAGKKYIGNENADESNPGNENARGGDVENKLAVNKTPVEVQASIGAERDDGAME
jgi:ankyrin repeat protein